MTEPSVPNDENPYEAAVESVGSRDPDTDKPGSNEIASPRRFPVRRYSIILIASAAVIFLLQWFAPVFDHQNANMLSVLVGLLLAIYFVVSLHRVAASYGYRWRVPVTVACLLAAFFGCFRLEGFSGELMPKFVFRFAPGRVDLEAVTKVAPKPDALTPEAATSPESGGSGNDLTDDSASGGTLDGNQQNSDLPLAPKLGTGSVNDSPQFLGVNRTGVIDRRFSVPMNGEAKVLWDQKIGDGWSSFSVSGNRAVTLEQRGDQECVSCYRLTDGELLWMQSITARHEDSLGGVGPRSTPTLFNGKVYAHGATGRLQCLDLQTGERIWTVDLLEVAGWDQVQSEAAAPWGHASSPLLVESSTASQRLCVVGFGAPVDVDAADEQGMTDTPKGLIALDPDTGEVVWKAGRDQFSYASPNVMTLDGRRQIVAVNEKTVTGHEIDSGKQLWSIDWIGATNANANCAMAVPVGDSQFLVGKGYGGGSALVSVQQSDAGEFSAEADWMSTRVLRTKFNHACVKGDVAYAISNGSLQAVRLSTAETLWTQPRRQRFEQGQVVLAGDVLVAQAERGDVVFVAADQTEYRELARIPSLSSKTWNIPTVAGRHVLVRNDRQAICYLLPPSE